MLLDTREYNELSGPKEVGDGKVLKSTGIRISGNRVSCQLVDNPFVVLKELYLKGKISKEHWNVVPVQSLKLSPTKKYPSKKCFIITPCSV